MSRLTFRRELGGVPYTFAWNAENRCWDVCPVDAPIARISRAYAVYVGPDGTPLRCSCPHATHAGAFCKHLKMAKELQAELNPEALAKDAQRVHDAAVKAGAFDKYTAEFA